MMQQTLALAGDLNTQYEQLRRPTRRDAFLATMGRIVQACQWSLWDTVTNFDMRDINGVVSKV